MAQSRNKGEDHNVCTRACLRRRGQTYWCARYSWGGEHIGVIEHQGWRKADLQYKLTKEEFAALVAAPAKGREP